MKRLMSYFFVFMALAGFVAPELFGQNFTNNTNGSYSVGATGTPTIRMRASGGKFDGSAALGTTAAAPIPGTVDWGNSCTNPMNIGGANNGTNYVQTFYTNLTTSGTAVKTFLEDFAVAGTYVPSGGNRNYTANSVNATFNGTIAQTVPGENTPTNGTGYYDLTLSNTGAKSIATGTVVSVSDAYVQSGGDVTDNGTVTLGSAPSTASSNITVADGGKWTFGTGTFIQSGATTTFTNNAGSVAGNGVYLPAFTGAVTFVNFTNTTGEFTAASGTTINMGGAFTAAAGSISFDCNANFIYNGAAQTILANATTPYNFPSYGNLTFGGTGTITAGGDVSVCKNLAVNQMASFLNSPSDYTLTMLNTGDAGAATYASTAVELKGNMKWLAQTAGKTYTYNNTNTTMKFATAPASGNYVALDVQPTVAPTNYNNANPATDVHRRIVATYDGTAAVISDLTLQWYASDETGVGYSATNNNLIRFAEGYSNAANDQKIIRKGANYTRTVGADPRYVLYNGGGAPGIALTGAVGGGTVNEITSGSEIILTQAPMDPISITNGRWSNPDTWDTGLMPTAADNVHVRSIVYTGIEDGAFGGAPYTGDEFDGSLAGDAGASANSIIIEDDPAATPNPNSALVIGNKDQTMRTAHAGGEYIFRTRMNSGVNLITNVTTHALSGDGDGTTATGVNGIWVRSASTDGTYGFVPVLGTYQLTNAKGIQNNSIIEIGVCN